MPALFSHLPGLLKISGQASILILLVLAVQWLCGRRLSPRWRCALWLLVLLRLALPWSLPSPASLFNVVKLPVAAQSALPETAPAPMVDAPIAAAGGVAMATVSARGHWLAWLWAAGALGLAGCAAANHYKIHRQVTRRRPLIDGPTLNSLEDCKALMGVRTPVTLIETEAIKSPALFGFIRPRLLLPAGLASGFTRQELHHVFLHELAHIKRHDVLVGWVMLGLQTLHWFNPLVWLAFHRLRADRELACDALVLSCAQPGENQAYGLTIIKLLERFGQSIWAPSLAGILENKQQMKERINMIAQFHKTDRGLALAVSLFAGLALVTLTDAQNIGNAAASDAKGPPRIIATLPALGATDVDPALPEITVTFDRDMKGGFSWVGGGPNFPVTTDKPKWRDNRTCAFPVKLEAAHYYRVGINSPPYRNFRSANGVPAIPSAIYFTTQGASEELQKQMAQEAAEAQKPEAADKWDLQQKLKMAEGGDQWAAYDLWDAYYRGHHGVQPDPAQADQWLGKSVQDVWVVRFEPVDDFAPTDPGEFLGRIHQYSSSRSGQTNIGAASFFRTTKQGDKLVGSFLSNYPDELKADLAKVPGLKVTTAERITPEEFIKYEQSPQESLWNLQQKLKQAEAGNQWAVYDLWDAYYRGHHGVQPDLAQADKWLGELVRDVWVVKFEPVDDFAPTGPVEFLDRINQYSSSRSGLTNIGGASFFRTTKQGDKLVGSFLSNYPDELKADLAKVPGLKVTTAERITPEEFIKYEQSPQESLWSLQQKLKMAEAGDQLAPYELWDAYHRGKHGIQPDPAQADKWLKRFVQDLWVVRFEPTDGFAPTGPGEFLARINQHFPPHSGKPGIMVSGFFRTTQQGDKLVGAFLSGDPDELKAGLANVPGVKVVSSKRITPEEFMKYEQSPQESLSSP